MEKVKVSIIIPVYNAEKYLKECIESIINQELKEVEIICINDGSTDNSLSILKKYAKKDKRIVIIDQKNKGVNTARSNGYKIAKGEYIAWADNDDIVEHDMYSKMYKAAKENKSDIVICNYKLYPKKNSKKEVWYKPYTGSNDWKFIAKNTTLWNKIVSKKHLDKVDIVNLLKYMGESSYSIVLATTNKIITVDDKLYNYRIGHGSVSASFSKIKWFKDTVESAYKKYSYSKELEISDEVKGYFYYTYLYYNLVLASVAARNNRKEIYNNAKNILVNERFFSRKYSNYFKHHTPKVKRIIFRYFVYPNYTLAKITTKIILR